MRSIVPAQALITLGMLFATVSAGDFAPPSPRSLASAAQDAVWGDDAACGRAIETLRDAGPAGLDALMAAEAATISARRAHPAIAAADADHWRRLAHALDAVAAQRDAWACGLYWYTDMAAARMAAQAAGKPILSLRLLGRLDQDLSCANSRYFRTTLYSNAQVSRLLHDHFVLHWQSERPAPRLTIDFGDGRKIERTITGNSIHYLLDAQGRIIDALPGLYGPAAFVRWLNEDAAAAAQADTSRCSTASEPGAFLVSWHVQKQQEEEAALAADLQKLRLPAAPAMDDVQGWQMLGRLHAGDAVIDPSSRELITAKNPDAMRAGNIAISKRVIEAPLVRAMRNLEDTIAADTERNEYLLHPRIHQWLAAGNEVNNLELFNRLVYAELFLTPRSDPWLGLAPPDVYSGLDDNGEISAGH